MRSWVIVTDVVTIELKHQECEQLKNIVAQARRVAAAKLERCQVTGHVESMSMTSRSAHVVNVKHYRLQVERILIIEDLIERAQLKQ